MNSQTLDTHVTSFVFIVSRLGVFVTTVSCLRVLNRSAPPNRWSTWPGYNAVYKKSRKVWCELAWNIQDTYRLKVLLRAIGTKNWNFSNWSNWNSSSLKKCCKHMKREKKVTTSNACFRTTELFTTLVKLLWSAWKALSSLSVSKRWFKQSKRQRK